MRKSLVAAVMTASALALASCAMPADDPNFGGASGAGEQIDEAVASANAADQAALDEALLPPTSIGVDAPLAAAPASGAALISLTDGSEYEAVFETALAEAADVLGWTVESVPVDFADPTTIATAFDEAVAAAPAGIHITGGMVDALVDSLPAAEAAGIPVVCTGCSSGASDAAGTDTTADATTDSTDTASAEASAAADGTDLGADTAVATAGITDASIDGTEQNSTWGDVLASYVFDNQYAGEDASPQVFVLPGGAMADFNVAFANSLSDQCRNCGATESIVDPTFTDLTDPLSVQEFVAGEMSTALGAWAVLDSGLLSSGVADALANDPLMLEPGVTIGRGASAEDIANLQALEGTGPAAEASPEAAASPDAVASDAAADDAAAEDATAEDGTAVDAGAGGRTPEEALGLQAWIGIPQPVMAWRVVDQFARIIGGEAPATGPLPSQLLTTGNASEAVLDENGNYIGIADYQDQFKALWGVQ